MYKKCFGKKQWFVVLIEDFHLCHSLHFNKDLTFICFPDGSVGRESTCNTGHKRCRFDPWVRKIPWSRTWQPTSIFLPTEFHGQRSLVGYSLLGCKESDMTEQLSTHMQGTHLGSLETNRMILDPRYLLTQLSLFLSFMSPQISWEASKIKSNADRK